MIRLVNDTIDNKDIESLIEWLKTNPRLTKDKLTIQFEDKWSNWLGVNYSIYVNSGSSANLAIIYALSLRGLRNKKVVVPAISWVTTVSPIIQFGLEPILCEADKETLAIDINDFERICKEEEPSMLVLVHVLGIPANMNDVLNICNKYGVLLVEDCCESIGSIYENKKVGSFGIASSFSFYAGHHISSIEGGMISTNDYDLYCILKSIRGHGWNRDLPEERKIELRNEYNIDEFRDLYTFYYPGFNLRSTDLQAFLGLKQLEKIDFICEQRNKNLKLYDLLINNNYWKLNIERNNCFISNFAYPIITPKINELVNELNINDIETRPLICGSMGRQPFWIKKYGIKRLPFADKIHDYGLYLPNNHQINKIEVKFVCNTVNKIIGE